MDCSFNRNERKESAMDAKGKHGELCEKHGELGENIANLAVKKDNK